MYNLKKAGMENKKSDKCLNLFQTFVLWAFVVLSLQSCNMNTKDAVGSVSAVEYCFIQCPTGDND